MTKIKTLVALALLLALVACGAAAEPHDSDEGEALAQIAPTIARQEQDAQSDALPEPAQHEPTSRDDEPDEPDELPAPTEPEPVESEPEPPAEEPEPVSDPDAPEPPPVDEPEPEPVLLETCVSLDDCRACTARMREDGRTALGGVCHYQDCESDDECDDGLVCDSTRYFSATVCRVPLTEVNDPCESDDECEPGLYCLPRYPYSTEHTCQVHPLLP